MNIYKTNINRAKIEKILYNSGDFFLPKPIKTILDKDILGSSKHTFYFSGWSVVHFLSGILTGYLYLYFGYNNDKTIYYYKMFILHTIWELWQMLIGMSKPYNLTGPSNIIDTVFDTIYFMMGTYIAYLLTNYYNAFP